MIMHTRNKHASDDLSPTALLIPPIQGVKKRIDFHSQNYCVGSREDVVVVVVGGGREVWREGREVRRGVGKWERGDKSVAD